MVILSPLKSPTPKVAYVQSYEIPYSRSLRGWLGGRERASSSKPWELQSLLQQILLGIAKAHSRGVALGSLSVDSVNIVSIKEDGATTALRPYLRQLSSSTTIDRHHRRRARQLEHISTDTRTLLFSPSRDVLRSGLESSYIAPEILSGNTMQATCAGDMWAFGAILFRSLFGFQREIIVAAANKETRRASQSSKAAVANGLAIPTRASSKLKINVRLQDLLSKLLIVEPEKRLSAEAVSPVSTYPGKQRTCNSQIR